MTSSNSPAFARPIATNLKATLALRGASCCRSCSWRSTTSRSRVLVGADAASNDFARLAAADVQLLSVRSPPRSLTVTVAGGVRHLGRLIEDGDLTRC